MSARHRYHARTLAKSSGTIMEISITVRDEVAREAEQQAQREGISVQALYARAVEQHLVEQRRRQAAQRIDQLIGRAEVSGDAEEVLHALRSESDRKITP